VKEDHAFYSRRDQSWPDALRWCSTPSPRLLVPGRDAASTNRHNKRFIQ
jgi:hypothetical protein